MLSKAAMDGIRDHGHGWRSNGPRIRVLCERFGYFRDNSPEDDVEGGELLSVIHEIEKRINDWLDNSIKRGRVDHA